MIRELRQGWPALVTLEMIVGLTILGFGLLGAPTAVLLTAGLLFGVAAPAAGMFLSWATNRRHWH
jgi:hypothetical protein